jgi:hypothetical protein
MKPRFVNALASATKPIQPGDGYSGRTFFKALLLAGTLLSGGLAIQPADASLVITTTGTIISGSETGEAWSFGAVAPESGRPTWPVPIDV